MANQLTILIAAKNAAATIERAVRSCVSEPDCSLILIDDHCIGCGLCAHNCPFGNITMAPTGHRAQEKARQAVTCDLCDSVPGKPGPACVSACPHACLERPSAIDFRRMASK